MSESSTSEEDSDDAEQQRLKEAVVDVLQFSRPSTDKINHLNISTDRRYVGKPSLRPRQTEPEDCNNLSTTPEFRAHVALKLSQLLDNTVNTRVIRSADENNTPAQDEGIRMFQRSSRAISEFVDNSYTVTPRRRRCISSSEDSSEDERLAEAAVSHDFIIRESERLAGCSQTDLEKSEKVSDTSFRKETIDKIDHVHKKCKKKKRHKHYKVADGGSSVS